MTTPLPRTRGARRRSATVATALLVTLSAAACGNGETSASDNAGQTGGQEVTKITVATPFADGSPAQVPMWMGENVGFFEEEGLDVEVVSLAGRPAEAVGLVTAGQSDLVTSVPDTLIVPASKGNNPGLKWVFTPYQEPIFALAVPADSPIQTPADLAGKTIGMSALGPPFETFTRATITADGGDDSGITPVAVAGPAAMESLASGDLDAIVASSSEIVQAAFATGTDVRRLELPESVKQTFAAGFLMRDNATEEEKDAYARYIRAYIKAGVFAQENPEAVVRMNWERFPASKSSNLSEDEALEQAEAVLLATVGEWRPAENGQWGYLGPERWDAHIEYLGLTGQIEDPATLYDDSLLETINDWDEEEVRQQAADWQG